jgi:hypothetical protein
METAQLEEQLSSSSRQLQHSQQLVSELENRSVSFSPSPNNNVKKNDHILITTNNNLNYFKAT